MDQDALQCLPDCSGHGTFDLDAQTCTCEAKWSGDDCSKGMYNHDVATISQISNCNFHQFFSFPVQKSKNCVIWIVVNMAVAWAKHAHATMAGAVIIATPSCAIRAAMNMVSARMAPACA